MYRIKLCSHTLLYKSLFWWAKYLVFCSVEAKFNTKDYDYNFREHDGEGHWNVVNAEDVILDWFDKELEKALDKHDVYAVVQHHTLPCLAKQALEFARHGTKPRLQAVTVE